MVRAKRERLLVAAVTLLSMVGLIIASIQISRFIRYGDVAQLGARLDAGRSASPKILSDLAVKAEGIMAEGICQRDFSRSGLMVLLTDLDNHDPDLDYEQWAQALARAERFTRFSLGCSPTDGDLWLRLAMIQQAIAEQPDEVAHLVMYSQLYAPAEGNVVAGRYRLYNRLSAATLLAAAEPIDADLKVLCSEPGSALRRRLPAPAPAVELLLEKAVPNCVIGGGKRR